MCAFERMCACVRARMCAPKENECVYGWQGRREGVRNCVHGDYMRVYILMSPRARLVHTISRNGERKNRERERLSYAHAQ